jgi:1-acyl-sn-glycerol-3-phosphate acyltransferase
MATWYQNTVWRILKTLLFKKLRNKYNMSAIFHDEEPSPPFILMANHSHIRDPQMIGAYMKNTINYMANVEGVSGFQRFIAKLVGAYGKQKGAPDIKALKMTIDLLKDGHVVGIFPEGDRSWDGETAAFIPGSAVLAKKYKIPIRIASLTGNYITFPRWAKNARRGRILIDYYTISKEEVINTEIAQLQTKIISLLHHDDIKDQKNKNILFTGKAFAEGIQYLLWLCPQCGEHDTLYGEENQVICSSCGAHWLLDGSLRISTTNIQGEDLKDWSKWQEQELKSLCENLSIDKLTETKSIVLAEKVKRKLVNSCRGDLILYRNRVEFISDNCENITFTVNHLAHYIDNFNQIFEFDYRKKRYSINFNGKNASKWIYFLDYLKSNQ